ncbi:GAF domain-containing protein [Arthrobacter sp. MDB2-24]
MNEGHRRELTADALRRACLSVAETWIQYFALGGSRSQVEIEAYLRGEAELPPLECELLAEAAREASGEGADAGGRPGTELSSEPAADIFRQLGAAGSVLLDPETAEDERLRSLAQLHLLDTPPEDRFDRITRRAAERFGCELATLALIADDRQFIKSAVGEADQDLERTKAFCNATIRSCGPLVMTDTTQDGRFRFHPFVAGEPHIRFYASYPLRGPGGWLIGTLCVMSTSPRPFTDQDLLDLELLAHEMQHEVFPGWKAWNIL